MIRRKEFQRRDPREEAELIMIDVIDMLLSIENSVRAAQRGDIERLDWALSQAEGSIKQLELAGRILKNTRR